MVITVNPLNDFVNASGIINLLVAKLKFSAPLKLLGNKY